MYVISFQSHMSRSTSTARKLVKHKFASSGAVDGCNHRIVWLKFFSNSRGKSAHDLLKEADYDHVVPLQVRGSKGLEIRLIAKYVEIVHNT